MSVSFFLTLGIPNGTHSDDEHETHGQSCSFQLKETIRISDLYCCLLLKSFFGKESCHCPHL